MRNTIRAVLVFLAFGACWPGGSEGQAIEDYDYENLELRALGLELGGVWPSRYDATLSIGARADLGLLGPYVRLAPGVRFWGSTMKQSEVERLSLQLQRICLRTRTGPECPPLDLGEIRITDLVLDLDGHFVPETDLVFQPYAGAGIALHLASGSGEFIDGTFVEDVLDAISPGLNLMGGVELPIGERIRVGAEARYALASDLRFGQLSIGGAWIFPVPPATARSLSLSGGAR